MGSRDQHGGYQLGIVLRVKECELDQQAKLLSRL
jgi:hypothetical protein